MRKWIQGTGFTFWLFVAVGLALLLPGPASKGGVLHAEVTTKLGVWGIFFLLGLSIPLRQLAAGCLPPRLHVFVVLWNFLFFPLVTGLFLLLIAPFMADSFELGFWLLAIMPTTIASAVAFTDLAGGNASNAIFATVLSNVLSVFVVPMVAVAYLTIGSSDSISLLPLLSKIALLVLLPLILGQGIRRLLPMVAAWFQPLTKRTSSVIILFIVHAAFADSVSGGLLTRVEVSELAAVFVMVFLLLLLSASLVWWSSYFVRLDLPQRVAAFYCGSQKSLATGLPLATAILATVTSLADPALLLIPLLLFHPLQLILAGVLSRRFAALSQGA